MPTDWYAILEVEPTASPGDIRTAYRKQVGGVTYTGAPFAPRSRAT